MHVRVPGDEYGLHSPEPDGTQPWNKAATKRQNYNCEDFDGGNPGIFNHVPWGCDITVPSAKGHVSKAIGSPANINKS
jgi:hypothetical protein